MRVAYVFPVAHPMAASDMDVEVAQVNNEKISVRGAQGDICIYFQTELDKSLLATEHPILGNIVIPVTLLSPLKILLPQTEIGLSAHMCVPVYDCPWDEVTEHFHNSVDSLMPLSSEYFLSSAHFFFQVGTVLFLYP